MNLQVNTRNMPFLECFASETRVRIIELLSDKAHSIKELADALGLSSAIVTKHVQKMEDVGIIGTESVSGTRGRRKMCRLVPDAVTLHFKAPKALDRNRYAVSIPIGQYTDYQIKPTCGLSSDSSIIGMVDDPRYFSDPDHVKAKHIWLSSGYLEYRIPNFLVGTQQISSIGISLEICSEAPGYNESWPSDLTFYINDVRIGTWTCPGDFGSTRGVYTPEWWGLGKTQHGLLKQISIGAEGAYIDGIKLSDLNAKTLALGNNEEIRFRIACPEDAEHCGGISLFGKNFGNYDQEIEVTVHYDPE